MDFHASKYLEGNDPLPRRTAITMYFTNDKKMKIKKNVS
jgi:hypothetical protein